jgi:hypothetical protein
MAETNRSEAELCKAKSRFSGDKSKQNEVSVLFLYSTLLNSVSSLCNSPA